MTPSLKKRKCRLCKKEFEGYINKCEPCTVKENKEKARLYREKQKVAASLKKEKAKNAKVKSRIKKAYSKSTLLMAADEIFSLYIRLRDSNSNGHGICCSSGRVTDWRNFQAGHYFSREFMFLRFDPTNVHGQSFVDNVNLKGNIPGYREFMINKYGEVYEKDMFERVKQYSKEKEYVDRVQLCLEVIKTYLPKVLDMLNSKTFDVSKYFTRMKSYKKYIDSSEFEVEN